MNRPELLKEEVYEIKKLETQIRGIAESIGKRNFLGFFEDKEKQCDEQIEAAVWDSKELTMLIESLRLLNKRIARDQADILRINEKLKENT